MSGDLYAGPFGDMLRWIAGEDDTANAYSVLGRIAPSGAQSVPHEHHRSEAFYVIEGSLTFTIGGETRHATPGSYLIAPDMVSHGWRVDGSKPAVLMLIFAPSMPKSFFEEMDTGVRASRGEPLETAEMIECMRRHGWRE
jgi:quercetin dioxygenase-like cupin family protein